MTDRGVSTTLSYILSLAVLTILIAGILSTTGGFVESQQERVIRSGMEVIGNRIAADLAAVDRLALTAESDGSVRLETELPESVAGRSYTFAITDLGANRSAITLDTTDPVVSVQVTVKTGTQVAGGTGTGGAILISYDGTDIEVADA